jgi:hypothetical protein
VTERYVESAHELFRAYRIAGRLRQVERHARGLDASRCVSTIGATGAGITLVSVLSMHEAMLSACHPAGDPFVARAGVEDWCRELNNQLLGRLKNKLLGVGCELIAGLPSLVAGDIGDLAPPDAAYAQWFFASSRGVAATLAIKLDESSAATAAGGDEKAMREGDFALFGGSR